MSKGRYFCGGSALAVTLALSIGGAASAQDSLAAFNAADANGDAQLTQEEVATLPEQFRQSAVDRNGDGIVSMQEYLDSAVASDGTTVQAVTSVGSLIRGATETGIQPVEVYGREELEARGNPSMEELIRDLSEVGNIQSQSARGTNASGYGVVSINLRNLGSGRTLLTFNGVRLADDPATNGGGVNVTGGANQNANAVPMEVLSQLEILKDGGGATYGSDAVGGVVNFVPRRDLDGFEVRTNYTFIDGNDGNYDFNLQWGKRREDGEGDFLLSFFYSHQSALAARDVPFIRERAGNFYATPLPSTVPNFVAELGTYWFDPAGGSFATAIRPRTAGSTAASTAIPAIELYQGSPFNSSGTGTRPGAMDAYPVISTTGYLRDDACLRLGGFRTFSITPSPVCSYRRDDFENVVDEINTYRVFGQANFNISDRFRYRADMTYNKTVTIVEGLDLALNAPCDPLPSDAPSIGGTRDCTLAPSPGSASVYSVPGFNPAVRDYALRYYNQDNSSRIFTDAQIAALTGISGTGSFNGAGSYDPDGTGPIGARVAGAGLGQGYIPLDGAGNQNIYGRVLLPTGNWDPFIAMRNDAFPEGENTFQNQSQSFRTTQTLQGDLGSIFGNVIDFTLRATYSRNITQLEGRNLMTDRLQRALNGFGTDYDNFGLDGCTAQETSGNRQFRLEQTPTPNAFAGTGFVTAFAADPDPLSPFFGQPVFIYTPSNPATQNLAPGTYTTIGLPGFADPDGTGPLYGRRLAQAGPGGTGTLVGTSTGVPFTVGAGGGAGNAQFGFDPGASAGNGCFFFNPFASAVDISRLNGEAQIATSTQVGFVDGSAATNFDGVAGDYQGYAPGLGLQNSPGLVRWLYEYRESRSQSDTIVLDAIFNGTVENFQLPGGDIQWAAGGQYRYVHRTASTNRLNDRGVNPCPFLWNESDGLERETDNYNPSSTCRGSTAGVFSPTNSPSGQGFRETVTHAAFAEVQLPFHDRLTGALRYRYEETKSPNATEFIGASVISGGLKYDINDYFAVALDLSQTFDVPSTPDPGQEFILASLNPTANDIFTGVDNNTISSYSRSLEIVNVNLEPESGFNYTVRFLFQTPDRRVSANIDYYSIKVSGRPTTVTAGTIGRALTGNRVFGSNVDVDRPIDCSDPVTQQFFDPAQAPAVLGGPIISYVDAAGNITTGCQPNTILRGIDNDGDPDGDGNFFNDPADLGLYVRTVDRVNGGDTNNQGLDFGADFRVPRPIFGGQLTLSADASWTIAFFNADVFLFGVPVTDSVNNIGIQAGGFASQANIWRGSIGGVYRNGRHQIGVRGNYIGPIVDHAIATLSSTTTGSLAIPTSASYNLNPVNTSVCDNLAAPGIPLPYLPMPVAGIPAFDDPANNNPILTGEGAFNANCNLPQPDGLKVDPSFIINATYRLQLPQETVFSLTVDNLLDSDPPYQRYQYGYNPYGSIGVYGRTFKVGLTKKFQ